jgi:polyhydroxybutyrate depolymerase
MYAHTSARWRAGVHALSTIALLRVLVPAAPVAAAEEARALEPGTHELRVRVGDEERSYLLHVPPQALHVPPQAGSGDGLPLLIAFHGGGGRAVGYERYAHLDPVADREGFVVAYPNGSGGFAGRLLTWNAGRCCGPAMRDGADDVAFTRALVDDVAKHTAIDRSRVYATGHSNGAMMSYRVAAEAPDLVAAIAPVGGAMILESFDARTPVPVLHVHSVDDPRAPYQGGLGPPFPLTRHRVDHRSVETELRRWTQLNGCPAEPELLERRQEAETGHTAEHFRFAPCSSGAVVELWKLTGAGHGWPGGDAALDPRLIGPSTHVISASEEVWRFVSGFRKQAPAQTLRAD